MNEKSNSFSIIIPYKNGKIFLKECLESAINQDYTNYNIIVLGDITSNKDGGIDECIAMFGDRVYFDISSENLDITRNWKRIINLNLNDYMTILGYDDTLEISFLSTINKLINLEPNASLYHTHFNLINSNSDLVRKSKPIPSRLSHLDFLKLRCWNHLDVFASGYVFKTNDYIKIGGIDTTLPLLLFSDDLLFIKLSKISFISISESYAYNYRVHNSTSNINNFKKVDKFLDSLKLFIEILQTDILSIDELKNIEFDISLLTYRHVSLYDNFCIKLFLPNFLNLRIVNLSKYYTANKKLYFKYIYGNNLIYYIKSLSKIFR